MWDFQVPNDSVHTCLVSLSIQNVPVYHALLNDFGIENEDLCGGDDRYPGDEMDVELAALAGKHKFDIGLVLEEYVEEEREDENDPENSLLARVNNEENYVPNRIQSPWRTCISVFVCFSWVLKPPNVKTEERYCQSDCNRDKDADKRANEEGGHGFGVSGSELDGGC